MSAVKGTNKIKFDAGASGDNYIAIGEYQSRVNVVADTYEASSLASGSTISLANIPQEAKILDIIVMHDALGSGVTIKIGDSTTADRYIAATAAATAGRITINKVDGLLYQIGTASADDVIILTTGGATATGTIKVVIVYSAAG